VGGVAYTALGQHKVVLFRTIVALAGQQDMLGVRVELHHAALPRALEEHSYILVRYWLRGEDSVRQDKSCVRLGEAS